jgi:hypothetical protein
MSTMNEQFDKIAEMQRQAIEPARVFGAYAINTFEKFMQQNIAVMSDVVEYARAQAELAGQAQSVNEYVGQQIDQGVAFTEKMAGHVQHYVTLAGNTAQEAAEVTQREIDKVAKAQADA